MNNLSQHKEAISQVLLAFLQEKKAQKTSRWATDVLTRIEQFVTRGKMVRGSLVVFSQQLFGEQTQDALIAAGALELIHSSFLIHDDIMDEDDIRRGSPTIAAEYKHLAQEEKLHNSTHVGEGMAICAGDNGFFLGYELFTRLTSSKRQEIIALASEEFSNVCAAQMDDIYNGASDSLPTEEEILRVYAYKTGRYTFALPLMIGALLAEQPQEIVKQLGHIGETLGILFQIKDDQLGLFGKTTDTGKPVGSDILQQKKTLYWIKLQKQATQEEKHRMQTNDLSIFYDLLHKYKIAAYVDEKMQKLTKEITRAIQSMTIAEEKKDMLRALVQFSIERKS